MTPQVEAQIGVALRGLLNGNGLSHVKIVGYEVSCFPISFCHTDCVFTAQLGYCWSVSGPAGELLPLHQTRIYFVLVDASFWRFFCWCRIPLLCRICLQSGRVHECIPRQGNTRSDVYVDKPAEALLQEVYFTECSGTFGSSWWDDIKVMPLFSQSFQIALPHLF